VEQIIRREEQKRDPEAMVEATTSLSYYNFVINNPSSKSPPLHILLDAILVPPQRCFISVSGRPG
jgi:hypothetical protein